LWSFSETPALAQDWAYRWLAACAKASRERYQIPLLEERAIGDPLTVAEPPARALIVREARAGTAWTSRLAAGACGVTQATAAADLAALVRAGELRVQGAGRSRHYVVAR